jgi:hypothetical protein
MGVVIGGRGPGRACCRLLNHIPWDSDRDLIVDSEGQLRFERLRCFQRLLGLLLMAITTPSLLVSCVRPPPWSNETREAERNITATVDSLARKRPATLTRGQWGSAVGWTRNLVANSLLPFEADPGELRRFQTELEEKAKGDVDLSTILWIWDRLGRLTNAGNKYQRFRQQMLEEIKTVDPNADAWGMKVP